VEQVKPKYIAIEGVIGVGKTSLAVKLGERLNAQVILEKYSDNPYLSGFYKNPEQYAFQTQMAFLASRYKQQQQLSNRDLFHEYLVTDYIFDKDRIFAYLNLKDEELKLYENAVQLMDKKILPPDLVVYLQSSPERLRANIQRRARPFERWMSEDYIHNLHDAYNYFFLRYKKTPLLIVNVSEIDFVNDASDFELIYNLILKQQYVGTEYFKPEKKLEYIKSSV
jgi:deoxyguanosine kinase